VRLSVRKDKPYTKTPHFCTAVAKSKPEDEYYCTTGIDSGMRCFVLQTDNQFLMTVLCLDIREATRSAVRNMIDFLVADCGLDRVEAYMLCSIAGDLRMHEVVCAIK
jgi:acetamidase/formamidase